MSGAAQQVALSRRRRAPPAAAALPAPQAVLPVVALDARVPQRRPRAPRRQGRQLVVGEQPVVGEGQEQLAARDRHRRLCFQF